MMSRALDGVCNYCKHLDRRPMGVQGKKDFLCHAFPEGIPFEIVHAYYDHRRVHPEDKGIQFELDDRYSELPNRVTSPYASEAEQDETYRLRKKVEEDRQGKD